MAGKKKHSDESKTSSRKQWRIRTLLIGIALVCVLLAGRQVVVDRYQQQHAAVRWYSELDPDAVLSGFEVVLSPAEPTWLGWFFGKETFQDVTRVRWDLRTDQEILDANPFGRNTSADISLDFNLGTFEETFDEEILDANFVLINVSQNLGQGTFEKTFYQLPDFPSGTVAPRDKILSMSPEEFSVDLDLGIFEETFDERRDYPSRTVAPRDKLLSMSPEELFRRFKHFSKTQRLSLTGPIDDECLRIILANMTEVKFLDLTNSEVTPAGLSHVVKLKQLEWLGIKKLDETSPKFLNSMKRLSHLDTERMIPSEIQDQLNVGSYSDRTSK